MSKEQEVHQVTGSKDILQAKHTNKKQEHPLMRLMVWHLFPRKPRSAKLDRLLRYLLSMNKGL